jgi:hypothetical protein
MMFKFDLPSSKHVYYDKIIRTTDAVAASNLVTASCTREAVIMAISKHDVASILKAIDNYLPYLFGLVMAVEGQPHIRLNDPLLFAWTSALGSNKRAYFTDYTYRYEVVMILMTYAYAMCNRAWSINETTTEQTFEENSKQAAHCLKVAAGVFEYISSIELPRWLNLPADAPLEVTAPCAAALSLACIAAAQELAVKKAVLKGTSLSIIAKLSADVWHKYEAAGALLHSMPSGAVSSLNPTLKSFLTTCIYLQKANTLKFAGQLAMGGHKCGVAVAYLQSATKCLKDVSSSGTLSSWKDIIVAQKGEVEHFSCLYSKENDIVAFDKVPDETLLDIPEAKSIMSAVAYSPPAPAFQEVK